MFFFFFFSLSIFLRQFCCNLVYIWLFRWSRHYFLESLEFDADRVGRWKKAHAQPCQTSPEADVTFNVSKSKLCFEITGQLELNLNELAKPCADPDHCGNPRKDPGLNGKTMDLFTQKSTKGWWACYKPGVPEPQVRISRNDILHRVMLAQKISLKYEKLPKSCRVTCRKPLVWVWSTQKHHVCK